MDRREKETLAKIGGIMGALRCTRADLAKMTGIKYTTLMSRIGKKGDIGSMKLSELWAIEDAARRRGYKDEKGKST